MLTKEQRAESKGFAPAASGVSRDFRSLSAFYTDNLGFSQAIRLFHAEIPAFFKFSTITSRQNQTRSNISR
jgi:hypothetical protein